MRGDNSQLLVVSQLGVCSLCWCLRYKNVLPLLDYFTINIYPFLSSGTKGVAMSNLTGPEMNFLNNQISALRGLNIACGDVGRVLVLLTLWCKAAIDFREANL